MFPNQRHIEPRIDAGLDGLNIQISIPHLLLVHAELSQESLYHSGH
jgi:hypothetical protein